MKTNLKFRKKIITILVAVMLTATSGSTIYGATFGNSKNGASSTEVMQVKYNGAAWNYSGSGYKWASFKYTRNNRTLLTRTAKKGKVQGSVWDNLVLWGDKYTTKFSWNRG